MTRPPPTSLPEKIRVFVSSTIGECAEERQEACKAIQSLNHEPFLFEAAGARPYAPRDLYLPKLDQADIFVAIYKNSYGWVADGESISGLEDEYRHAMGRGMPCLVYLHTEDGHRDPRLSAIIAEIQAQSRITYCRYLTAADLYQRIRDDIESVVAQRFARAEQLEAVIRWDAEAEVSAILRNGHKLVPRPYITQEVLSLLDSHRMVQVTGESGAGKTTLLASIARDHGIPFVSGVHLSAIDLVNVIVNKLAPSTSGPQYHVSFVGACAALRDFCASVTSCTIVIDGIERSSVLEDLLNSAREIRAVIRIVYSVKAGEPDLGHRQLAVPQLTYDEISELMRLEGKPVTSQDLEHLTEVSRGNPLVLRYCIESGDLDCSEGLTNMELSRWRALTPRCREIVSYVAIAQSRLSLDELMQLIAGVEISPETIADDIAGARWFLTEDTYGYSIRHEHERITVLSELGRTPHKYAYYARRTASALENRGDYVGAFVALELASDPTSIELARAAVFDASRQGDYRRVAQITDRLLPTARNDGAPENLITLLLGLAEAEQQLGHNEQSLQAIEEADQIALGSMQAPLVRLVREAKLWQKATGSLDQQSLAEIHQLRDEYREQKDTLSFARLTLELSALMIRLDRYTEAVDESRRALQAFAEMGDRYGVSLAKRNLASALTALPGHDAEVAELLQALGAATSGQTKRERAWLCNVMVRRFRRARDFPAAEAYALEAIQIGDGLGDGYVSAINRMNLGNVYRDERNLNKALESYQQASALAKQIGERETEASATRLTASVYAEMGKPELAVQHAVFAIGLVRDTAAVSELVSCLETLGDAYWSARRKSDAAATYREAAVSALKLEDPDRMWEMAERALDQFADHQTIDDYLQTIDAVCGAITEGEAERKHSVIERLYRRLPSLLKALNERFAIGILGPYFRLMFRQLPAPVAQFMFENVSSELLAKVDSKTPIWRTLFPLIPLLTALPDSGISIKDTADLGQALAERMEGIHYKPTRSGAPHWVFTLGFAQPLICSVSALDDETETAVVCTLITLFLKGFETDIQEKIVQGTTVTAREVQVVVGSSASFPEDLLHELGSGLVEQPCIVTRPTRPLEDPVPTFVLIRKGIAREWAPGSGKTSALQILLGETLVEFVFQLFRGEVELEVLQPKIASLLRQTIS